MNAKRKSMETLMKISHAGTIVAALALTLAGSAHAQGEKTRAQVQAELAQAVLEGEVVVSGETGMKANELEPGRYPRRALADGRTRAQVEAELAAAVKNGELIVGDSGMSAREVSPGLYPACPPLSATAELARTGG